MDPPVRSTATDDGGDGGGAATSSWALATVLVSLVPGAVQGATTVLLGHPLDTAKTRCQTGGKTASGARVLHSTLHAHAGAAAGVHHSTIGSSSGGGGGASGENLPRALRDILRREGVPGLYRGASPPIVMMCTKRSLQFALFDYLFASTAPSAVLSSRTATEAAVGGGTASPTAVDDRMQKQQQLPRNGNNAGSSRSGGAAGTMGSFYASFQQRVANNAFLSGAVAGVSGTTLGCPMHVIKIQTQSTTREVTLNAWSCAVGIFRAEGLRGFYRGLPFHLLKDGCFASLYLGTYKSITAALNTRVHATKAAAAAAARPQAVANGGKAQQQQQQQQATALAKRTKSTTAHAGWWVPLVGGSVASMLTWTALYPLDTLKTVVQAGHVPSSWAMLRELRQQWLAPNRGGGGGAAAASLTSSVLSMYRGLGMALARAGPVSGIAMLAYETTKQALAS